MIYAERVIEGLLWLCSRSMLEGMYVAGCQQSTIYVHCFGRM